VRRDYSDRVIDRADWLDIRQRTEDEISRARREYARLTGSATVLSDIPPSERVRDAWESWSTDRRRAAIRAVLHRVIINPLPLGAAASPGASSRTRRSAANARWRSCGSASNSTGVSSCGRRRAAETNPGWSSPPLALRPMPLVSFHGVGCFPSVPWPRPCLGESRRAPRRLPGPRSAPAAHARPVSAARLPRRLSARPPAPCRSWRVAVQAHPPVVW